MLPNIKTGFTWKRNYRSRSIKPFSKIYLADFDPKDMFSFKKKQEQQLVEKR
jgi:hypothetical protein